MDVEKGMKQKIVEESLRLFSEKGYEGVSMREIASAVGIRGASIYYYFKGKEDIFHAIFEEMTKRYDDVAAMLLVPIEDTAEAAERFVRMDECQMSYVAKKLFSFFTEDEFVVQFRRLLVAEQNRSQLATQTLKDYYFDAPVEHQTRLFYRMQQSGAFTGYDARMMALHFYSPVYFILMRYDLGRDYDECIAELEQHVHYFLKLYK